MTLKKWFILMVLTFSSVNAQASLSNVNNVSASQRAAMMSYGESLSTQYPIYQLQLNIADTALLTDADIKEINLELFTFEEAVKSRDADKILRNKNFQYLTCRPCGFSRPD